MRQPARPIEIRGLETTPNIQRHRTEEGQAEMRCGGRGDGRGKVMIMLFTLLFRNKLRIPLEGTSGGW